MGSDGDGRPGLRLIVPALTLLLPIVLLAVGVSALPDPAPLAVPQAVPALEAALTEADAEVLPVAAVEPLAPAPAPAETPAALAVTPISTLPPTPKVVWNGPRTFTFVALGVDRRNDREIPRTDTIVIGKIDVASPRVNLISIPRDLLVDIPGYGRDRINTAYVYGEQFKEPDGGIGLLRRTIQKNFGVSVDHFGLVDFQCFRTAVDSLGGVYLNVPRAIVDTQFPTDDYGYKIVKFDTGYQRMDGERALEYARTRHSDSDFQRIQRQQLIMAALRDQVLQLRTLPALPTIIGGCRNMSSDLGWWDYLDLASSLRNLENAPVTFAAVDERMVVDTVLSTGASVLVPRWEPIRALFADAFGTSVPATANSTGPQRPVPSPSPLPMQIVPGVAGTLPGDAALEPERSTLAAR